LNFLKVLVVARKLFPERGSTSARPEDERQSSRSGKSEEWRIKTFYPGTLEDTYPLQNEISTQSLRNKK